MQQFLILCLICLFAPIFSLAQHEASGEDRAGFVGLPVVYYTPETRIGVGLAGVYFFRMKNVSPKTRLSSVQMLLTYTQNKQMQVKLPYEIHLNANKHILKGEVNWFKYPKTRFYGVGPHASEEALELYTTNNLWIRSYYLYQAFDNVFLGALYRLDNVFSIEPEDEFGELATGNLTGKHGGRSSGVGLVFSYDKRDNIFVPTQGPFIETAITMNRGWTGSQFDFVRWEIDARQYLRFSQHNILAFHGVLDASWGDPPFDTAGLLGHRSINRGYFEGRFRDMVMASIQAEFRLQLFRGDYPREHLPFFRRFGIVFFGSLGTVAPSLSDFQVGNIKPSFGTGLRFLFNRRENLSIRFDYGWGIKGNSGAYFMIGEAF